MSVSALLFLFLFLAGVGLALFRHPIFGLYTYLLTFYVAPANAWWGGELPDLRWTLIAAGVTLISVLLHGEKDGRPAWHEYPTARILIVFALLLWIQLLWAISPDDHLFLAILFTKYVVMFAVIYASLSDERKIVQFSLAHVVGCFIWGYTAYRNPGAGRLENIGNADVSGSAFASMHVSTGLAFAGFLFLGLANRAKWIAFGSIPFILNAIILMATRGAFVALIAAIPAAVVFAPRARRKLVLVYLILGGTMGLLLAHDLFWERMSTIVVADDQPMEASAASRFDIAQANLRMTRDYPLGVGHRGNDLLSPQYMPPSLLADKDGNRIRSAHNTIMAVLVDHGLLGLIILVMFHARIARALFRLKARPQDSLSQQQAAVCAALATSLVIYWANAQFANMTKSEIVIWIAALVAAIDSLRKPDEPEGRASRRQPPGPKRAILPPGRLRRFQATQPRQP